MTRRSFLPFAIGAPSAAREVSAADYRGGSYTAGIQEAHDALPTTGGVILVPSGECHIQRAIEITKDGVTIQGTGALYSNAGSNRLGTRIVVDKAARIPAAFYVSKGNGGVGYGASFRDFALEGGWNSCHGIWIYQDGKGGGPDSMGHNVISNVVVTNFGGKGIWIDNSSCIDVGYMEHVGVRGTGSDCIAVAGNDWTLNAINVGGSRSGCGLVVLGNRVEVIGGESDFNARHGAVIDGDRISFLNFKSECSAESGLVVAGYSKRTTIVGGQFNNNGTAGIQVSPCASDTIIQAVHAWNLDVYPRRQPFGIWVSGGPWAGPIIVNGCNLRGNAVNGFHNDAGGFVPLAACVQ